MLIATLTICEDAWVHRLKLTTKWMFVFGVLGIFTFQALAIYGIVDSERAFAQSIPENWNTSDNPNLVNFVDSEHGDTQSLTCAISVHQLSQLAASYPVRLSTKSHQGKQIAVATVTLSKNESKKALERIVGKDAARWCRTSVTNRNFIYMFLVPGIS